jgi:hypothetical protein
MNIPINLANSGFKGYFSVVEDEMIVKDEIIKIFHYSVVLDLSETKVRLINLYRRTTGEWITDMAEMDSELRNEIMQQIERCYIK